MSLHSHSPIDFSSHKPNGKRDLHVVLLLQGNGDAKETIEALGHVDGIDLRVFYRPDIANLGALHTDISPDVILLQLDLSERADLDLMAEFKSHHLPVVVLAQRDKELSALNAIRAGADDVVLQPIDSAEAADVLRRVARRPKHTDEGSLGKLIVVMHSSGGAGATTVATNAACAMAANRRGAAVGLLDLDIQFGNAADLLDLPSNSRIEDILEEPERLDQAMLSGLMLKHASGIRVLTAPRIPLPLTAHTPSTVSALLEVAKRTFGYTVVDLPVALEAWTDTVLRAADDVYVVIPPTVPGIHRTSQLLSLLQQEQLTHVPLKIVMNRHQGFGGNGQISPGQVSKAIGRPVDHMIPNDYKLVAQSQNQGEAAVQMKPSSSFSRAIHAMLSKDLAGLSFERRSRLLSLFGGA